MTADSTLYLDAAGIRRQVPVLPKRYDLPTEGLQFLGLIADLGEPGSIERIGWENLLRVHGFAAVVRAAARCYHQVGEWVKVTRILCCNHGAAPGDEAVGATMSNPTTLGDALPAECARVRKILGHYREIGPAGAFGAHMIEQDLAAADRAMISGDVSAMMAAYLTLKEIES